MELDKDGNPITPTNDENGSNPSSQESGADLEKRLKDTQAFATQKNQALIDFAKNEVERDPTAVERIPDKKIQQKVLQEKWGVETLDELKTLYPDALSPKGNKKEDDDEDEVKKLTKKVNLLEYKETKTKTKDAIDEIVKENKELIETIPDFEEKIKEEMKYISSDLSPKERVQKAFSIISKGATKSSDAYTVMQGVTIKQNQEDVTISDDKLKKAQDDILRMMRINTK